MKKSVWFMLLFSLLTFTVVKAEEGKIIVK